MGYAAGKGWITFEYAIPATKKQYEEFVKKEK